MKKRKRYRVLALAALLALGIIGGTVAYGTQTQQAVNEFRTGEYATKLVEEFVPPSDWQPGISVNKDVKVRNNGTVPVFASIKLHQSWVRKENVTDADGNIVPPKKGESIPNTFQTLDGESYAALMQWGKNVVLLDFGKASGSTARLGLPTVAKVKDAAGKWLLMRETPDSDGYLTFYYMGVLDKGEETPLLLDGVTMNPQIQAVTLATRTVWDKAAQQWVTTSTKNPTYDYQSSRFTLTATMNTVQATASAVKAVFGDESGADQSVISYLKTIAVSGSDADYSRDDSVALKKLYLEEKDGVLTYTPSKPEENWFMSHLNMMPGEVYEDTLVIENQTDKSCKVYLQVVPKEKQDKLPRDLLERIAMKVYNGDKLIYDGTALGKDYKGSINDLQEVVLLGEYGGKKSGKLRVELTLDKDTPMTYADQLTQIDWKFIVEDITDGTKGSDPKTGDNMNLLLYSAAVLVSGAGLLLLFLQKKNRTSQH